MPEAGQVDLGREGWDAGSHAGLGGTPCALAWPNEGGASPQAHTVVISTQQPGVEEVLLLAKEFQKQVKKNLPNISCSIATSVGCEHVFMLDLVPTWAPSAQNL